VSHLQQLTTLVAIFLEGKDLLLVSQVCKKWRDFGQDKELWKLICLRKWNEESILLERYQNSWKECWMKRNHHFQWRKETLSGLVSFTNEYNTVIKCTNSSRYQTVLGDRIIRENEGTFYWEIEVEEMTQGSWTTIGVCKEDMQSFESISFSNNGWGFAAAYKWRNGQNIRYGSKFSTGDVVGVLLDMNEKSLAFFVNGQWQGDAFKDMEAKELLPAVSLSCIHDRVTIHCGRPIPPKKRKKEDDEEEGEGEKAVAIEVDDLN